MKFSYRARLALIALLLVLSTLFASCDILVTVVPSTGTQETTLEETTPETTTPDASSPDETTLEESTPEEVETPEETSAEITTPEETTPQGTTTPESTTTPEATTTPEVTTPEITTPEITTPEVTTPEITTPEVTTPSTPTEPTPESGTAKVVISKYATLNGWTNGTSYESISLNSFITASAQGNAVGSYSLNTGKYYTNGQNWRLYQTEKATLTISGEGKVIVSVKVSYAPYNTGCLTLNGKNIASDTVVAVNANSITFGVGNTDATVTNGQVRITAIEVVYGGSAELPEETTPEPDVTIPEPEGTTSVPEVEETPKEFEELNIPAYSGSKFVAINNNVPFFTKEEYTTNSYES